jgi:hypothetical protein
MPEGPVVDILSAVREIRDLVRLLAEPAVAERDRKLRDELRRIVRNSVAKRKAVLLMDGSRTQRAIRREAGIDAGQLSTFVKELNSANLLSGDGKEPKLSISIPAKFFENESTNER